MPELAFNHACQTPKGKATFIGYVDNGSRVQVSRHARFDELSLEEIERVKPVIKDWEKDDVRDWLKKATYCKNEIYTAEEVTA